jgi:hypothetical protein
MPPPPLLPAAKTTPSSQGLGVVGIAGSSDAITGIVIGVLLGACALATSCFLRERLRWQAKRRGRLLAQLGRDSHWNKGDASEFSPPLALTHDVTWHAVDLTGAGGQGSGGGGSSKKGNSQALARAKAANAANGRTASHQHGEGWHTVNPAYLGDDKDPNRRLSIAF